MRYLNRLSDLLFILSRGANARRRAAVGAGPLPLSETTLYPAEHRALRELHAAGRRLATHWGRLAGRLGGAPAAPLRDGAVRARGLCGELAKETARHGLHGLPGRAGRRHRSSPGCANSADLGLERNQALRFAVLDAEHVATLLLYLAALAERRDDAALAAFHRRWAERDRGARATRSRDAAIALAGDPEDAIRPAEPPRSAAPGMAPPTRSARWARRSTARRSAAPRASSPAAEPRIPHGVGCFGDEERDAGPRGGPALDWSRGRRRGRPRTLDADGHDVAPARLLAGRHRRPGAQPLLRRLVSGLYRTDPALRETGRTDDVIPPSVRMGEGYNHIGDISWDAGEGGRLLLPLECYYPGEPNGGNTCGTGSIGVADPRTLQWRYYVKLDPDRDPEGDVERGVARRRAGLDLRRRRPPRLPQRGRRAGERGARRDPDPFRAAPGRGRPAERHHRRHLRRRAAVRRRAGPAARSGSGRSTSRRARGCSRPSARSRASRRASATASVNGGTLQWLIPPFDPQGRPPTYGAGHSTLLSLRPGPPDPPPPAVPVAPAAVQSPPPAGSPRVRLLKRSRATVLRQRRFAVRVRCPAACSVRITVRARGRTIARGAIRRSGIAAVRLTATGRRMLRGRLAVRLTLRITIRDAAGG